MPTLGEIFARLRARKGWSLRKLSLRTGINGDEPISNSAISLLERDSRMDPHISTVAKLARALEISVDDILIEAGMLPRRTHDLMPGMQEMELLTALRSIADFEQRQELLDHFIGLSPE